MTWPCTPGRLMLVPMDPIDQLFLFFLSKAMLFKGHPAMLISPGDPGMRYPQNVEGEMDT